MFCVNTVVQLYVISIDYIFSEDALDFRKIIYERISVPGQYSGDNHVLYLPSVIDVPDPPDKLEQVPLTQAGVVVN